MSIDFVPQQWEETKPRITVIGVGGAGGNAVNNMINGGLEGVEFVVANTDAQSLQQSLSEQRIQLGVSVTHGLGAGARPDIGRVAAEEALENIQQYLESNNMVFIAAGMGGGTGTGAAPVIARAAREQGILTVGVVTKPFQFEGVQRMRLAEAGLQELQQYVDTLIVIPNQNLFRIANESTSFASAFNLADEVLHAGVRGVTDLMVSPGLINLDFADIRTVMSEMGKAMMGTGEAEGDNRAIAAAESAINNPLLDNASIEGARGVLINITGGSDVTLMEVDEAASRICQEVDTDANIIFGTSMSDELEGHMRVAVIATGIDADLAREPIPEDSDKVHVLGITNRRGADTASSGIVGKADTNNLNEQMTTDKEESEYEDFSSAKNEIGALSGSPSEESIPSKALTENLEISTPTKDIRTEPLTMSDQASLGENNTNRRRTVPVSSAGGVRAGVITQKDKVKSADSKHTKVQNAPESTSLGNNAFIPKPSIMPGKSETVGLSKKVDPFQVASMENAGGSNRKKGLSLFERMTGTGRGRKLKEQIVTADSKLSTSEKITEQRPQTEATKEPTFKNMPKAAPQMPEMGSTEEDPLEIPAFLRRQAN